MTEPAGQPGAIIFGHRGEVLAEVAMERHRQDTIHGVVQDIPNGTGGQRLRKMAGQHRAATDRAANEGRVTWRHVLLEEVYEALAEEDEKLLREELIQTAAVCVKWVEHLDRKGATT